MGTTPLHYLPFAGEVAGAARSMLALASEQVRRGQQPVVVLPVGGPVVKLLEDAGVIIVAAYAVDQAPRSFIGRARRISHAIAAASRENHCAVHHVHSAAGVRHAWWISNRLDKPLICHQRDTYRRDRFHFGLSRVDHVIAISKYVLETLPPKLRQKSTMIYNATAIPAAENIKDLATGPEPVRLGMAGRCTSDKGQDLFIRALNRLEERDVTFQAAIWGLPNPAKRDDFADALLTQGRSLGEKLKFEGFRSDIETFYQWADVVAVPSRFKEPFGRMAIEAMSWARPVVVAAHGGLTEIVTDGEDGLAVAPLDSDALADGLERLVLDGDLRRRVGENARQTVLERFTLTHHAQQIEQFYADVLDGR